MTLRRWILAALSIVFVALPYASGKYPGTPTDVVRLYCDFDLKTGRISTANFAKLPPLIAHKPLDWAEAVPVGAEF